MGDFRFTTQPVDEDEDVVGVFYGNRSNTWGSQFVVTTRRLLLGPLDVALAEDILAYVLGKENVPGVDVVQKVLDQYGPKNRETIWPAT
jgi:hypothetical protein